MNSLTLTCYLGLALTLIGSLPDAHNAKAQGNLTAGSIERAIKWISFYNAPLDLVDVRIAGKIIHAKPTVSLARRDGLKQMKVQGNANWLRDLSFTLKNVSGKPIAASIVVCRIRHPELKYPLNLPLKSSKGLAAFLIPEVTPSKHLEPDKDITYSFHEAGLRVMEHMLNGFGAAEDLKEIELNIERVQFDYETIWSDGLFSHPDPNTPGRWEPERNEVRSRVKPHVKLVAFVRDSPNLGSTTRAIPTTLGSDIFELAPKSTKMTHSL